MGRHLGVVGLLLLVGAAGPVAAQAPAPAASLQGAWRSGGTTMRITLSGTQARALFAELGQGAKDLGFKPGEPSFIATVNGNYLYGEQTIRYRIPNCHPNGRKVPMMGRMTPDGKALAIHYYLLTVDATCRDTGQYRVDQTVWERVPGR